ncbi:hypothetical protein ACLMJK_004837 [Lecanora helva]
MLKLILDAASGGTGEQTFSWEVQTYNSSTSVSPVYYMKLDPGTPQGYFSNYFHISDKADIHSVPSATTITKSFAFKSSDTPASHTSVSERKTAIATSPSITQSSLGTFSASPSRLGPNSNTVKIGLSAGLGIGIPLILMAIVWVGLRFVRHRRASSDVRGTDAQLPVYPELGHPPSPDELLNHASQVQGKPLEVHGNEHVMELGSGEVTELASRELIEVG